MLKNTGLGYTVIRAGPLLEEPGGYKALIFDQVPICILCCVNRHDTISQVSCSNMFCCCCIVGFCCSIAELRCCTRLAFVGICDVLWIAA